MTNKIKKILRILLMELILFGFAGLLNGLIEIFSPKLTFIPVAARFLGLSIAFHIYMGFIELKELRKKPYAKGEL